MFINAKLAIGVPVKDVYRDLRSNLASRNERDSGGKITKEDCFWCRWFKKEADKNANLHCNQKEIQDNKDQKVKNAE